MLFENGTMQRGKLKTSLFLFAVLFCRLLPAQHDTLLPFRVAFKWAPFGIFDFFSGPNMKAGLDFRYSKNIYGGLDGGAILFPYPPSLRRNSGFFVRKEIKFFDLQPQRSANGAFYYWGFELMYKYQQFGRSDSVAIPGQAHYQKDYTMFRNIFALHVKAGGILYFIKNSGRVRRESDLPVFFLEIFAGAGIRQSTGYCAGLSAAEADNRSIADKDKLDVMLNTRNGFHAGPSFVLSMKFGWKLK